MGPFLSWILLMSEPDKSLKTTVYRKPTHTHLYLQWDGQHNLATEFSVINTLTHKAETICSSAQLLKREQDY